QERLSRLLRRPNEPPPSGGGSSASRPIPPWQVRLAAMEWLSNPDAWVALLTLTVLEVGLGIDHIIFISILSGNLPQAQQARARNLGLGLAMLTRILLLLAISWVIGLTAPLFGLFGQEISGRDLIL